MEGKVPRGTALPEEDYEIVRTEDNHSALRRKENVKKAAPVEPKKEEKAEEKKEEEKPLK